MSLLKGSAHVDHVIKFPRMTETHAATLAGKGSGAVESAIPVLAASGANLDAALRAFPVASATPLILGVFFNNLPEVEVLLRLRADPGLRGRFFRFRGVALDFAKKYQRHAVQALLEAA